MSFYEIRPDLLKQQSENLRLRVFYDRNSDILVWEDRQTGEVESFQLSFRNLRFVGESEVIIEWRKNRAIKFGQVDEGTRLLKMTGIIHFKPLVPSDALKKMNHQFEKQAEDIDPKIRQFILARLMECLDEVEPPPIA